MYPSSVERLGKALLFRETLSATIDDLKRKAHNEIDKNGNGVLIGETIGVKLVGDDIQVFQLPGIDPNQVSLWDDNGNITKFWEVG